MRIQDDGIRPQARRIRLRRNPSSSLPSALTLTKAMATYGLVGSAARTSIVAGLRCGRGSRSRRRTSTVVAQAGNRMVTGKETMYRDDDFIERLLHEE